MPIILVPRGIEGAINVTFKPICLNGQPSRAVSSPCSDAGNAITSVSANTTSNLLTRSGQVPPLPRLSYISINAENCGLDAEKEVVCFVVIDGVPNYLPVNITLQTRFANSQLGPLAATDFQVVASPMVTPRTLASLYNIPLGERVTNPKATQAVAEFEQQYYDRKDLAQFFESLGIRSDTNVTVIGPNYEQNPGVEGTNNTLALLPLCDVAKRI